MNSKIKESFESRYENRILPFLWMHGESHERMREEILAIKNSGITEFCAESRPFEEFGKEKWWDDFGYVLETAEELGMKVWLLDDKKFPTGYANGYLEAPERAHLRQKMIKEMQMVFVGPARGVTFNAEAFANKDFGDEIISVTAYKHTGEKEILDPDSAIVLTDKCVNGKIYWDVPCGIWRVCVTYKTGFKDDGNRFSYYIDMLSPESCKAMIKGVYEPQFEHFGKYFGNTFRGFFSDEPGFGNKRVTYEGKLGVMYDTYPWREDMPSLIAKSSGIPESEIEKYIPAMWEDLGEKTALIRTHYMEVVSKLYGENFCKMLGDWCREHGVMYIGHVIEDSEFHMRLAQGVGHFFRALEGQDMSGMDLVLIQYMPGVNSGIQRGFCSPLNHQVFPEFYNYMLPKLAASCSHVQPLKQGRAMCELFGAFGWVEGLPYMKHMADLLLASGINHFVPHAFTPKEDDPDCPPHFYNGGKNPQYHLFKNLMDYINKTAHVLCGGEHKASVAVFYNAEGDWTGGKNELFRLICKNLTRGLIDFDIIPLDALQDAKVENGKLIVGKESYGALLVSETEIMPKKCLDCFNRLSGDGLEIIFTNSLPVRDEYNNKAVCSGFTVVKTDETAAYLRAHGKYEISAENAEDLRFYHVSRGQSDIYMFSNESLESDIDTFVSLPQSGEYLVFDAWSNKYYRGETAKEGLKLVLERGNTVIVAFGDDIPSDAKPVKYETDRKKADLIFDISLKNVGLRETEFSLYAKESPVFDITAPGKKENFNGDILYETEVEIDGEYSVIDLGEVGETAEVWLNGQFVGARITAPYKFDLSEFAVKGKNKLQINVVNNAAHLKKDPFSPRLGTPPSGIIGDIYFCKYE